MNSRFLLVLLGLWVSTAQSQMRPPPFLGGIPGRANFQAIQMQRHQARTLLYREALEELRKNPAAADVRECTEGKPSTPDDVCIPRPAAISSPPPFSGPIAETTPAAPPPAAGVATERPTQVEAAVLAVPETPGRKVALVIGINGYLQPIPTLTTPIGDVEAVGDVLNKRFGYEVRLIRNATKTDIVKAFNQLAADTGQQDSVLIMYAGHGYLMEETNMGYWIPADASVKTAANWVSNSDIAKFLRAIPSRQLLLVSDSCFSGSLTREQKVAARGLSMDRRARSVIAFSSGGEEPVSDEGREGHSIFAYYFIQMLGSSTGITPGFEVYRNVKERVTKEFPQDPQYGAVTSAGHSEGGEYFFQAH